MKKAFTLIELVVVIAIIGILVGIVFGAIGEHKKKSKKVYTVQDVRKDTPTDKCICSRCGHEH
jgi:prepilin-type N-terminal cleavage/methylation domain-containing protein